MSPDGILVAAAIGFAWVAAFLLIQVLATSDEVQDQISAGLAEADEDRAARPAATPDLDVELVDPVDTAEWDGLAEFIASATRDPRNLSMDELLAERSAARQLLALVATFPQVPAVREVEDLLQDEEARIVAEISARMLAGLAHPRYASPDAAA